MDNLSINTLRYTAAPGLSGGYTSPNRRRAGFTLIELLAVIAVIVLLAALIFPAFGLVKEKAHQIGCLSNEKQITAGILMYAQDYDERLPYWNAAFLTSPSTEETPDKLWKSSVQPYIKNGNPASFDANGIAHPETGVWMCPSLGAWQEGFGVPDLNPDLAISRAATASYGISMFIVYDYFGTTPQPPATRYRSGMTLAELRAPAETVLLGEGGLTGRIDTPITRRWLYYQQTYNNPKVQNWERRNAHTEGSNYAFCDGHVHWESAETIYPHDLAAAKLSARLHFAATETDYQALGGTK